MKNAPLIMGLAWAVLCLAVVLLGMALTLSPLELEVLAIPLNGPLLTITTGVVWAAAVALLWVGGSHARGQGRQVPFARLILFFPLLLAFIWLVHVPGRRATGELVLGPVLLVAAAWLWWKSPPLPRSGSSEGRFWPWDALLILAPALMGLLLGARPDLRAAGLSVLLYPAFALLQLAIFLLVPARLLRGLGLSAGGSAILCAAVFSLLHAPNAVLMAATAAAMFVWCRQYLLGRPVWRLALIMGLAATVFSQFLPDDLTGHMRIGPGHTRARVMDHLAAEPAGGRAERLIPFLERVYPRLLERAPTPEELTAWNEALTEARLTGLAWQFFNSPEYRRKAAERGWPRPPGLERHWTAYEPEWRDRIGAFGQPAYLRKCGSGWTDFLKCLYRDILRRQGSAAELESWTRELTSNERRTLARLLLDHRLQWRRAPFTGLPVEEMRLRR